MLTACSRKKQVPIVAKIDDEKVTLVEFQERLAALPPQMQVMYAYEEGYREFLDSLVEQKVLYQEAKRQGLDRDEVIRSRIDNYVDQTRLTIERNIGKLKERLAELESSVEESLLAREMLDRANPAEIEVSEEEIKEYYDEAKAKVLQANPEAQFPDLGMVRRELRRHLARKKYVERLKEDAILEIYYDRLGPQR